MTTNKKSNDKDASLYVSEKYHGFMPIKSSAGFVAYVECKYCGKRYNWEQLKRQRDHSRTHKQ